MQRSVRTTTAPSSDSSSSDPSPKPPVKLLTPHRHLQRIKRILRDIVCVELIHFSHNRVAIRLIGFCEDQKLDPSWRLGASQPEVGAFKNFKASQLRARYRRCNRRGCQRASDGMDSMEGTSEDKVVI